MKDIKLLLVDDEEDFIQTLAERLTLRNLKSDVALDGKQALEAIKEEVPDVVVLDLKMPGMGGMEVLRLLKQKYPGVQVIIQTGHGTEIDRAEAQELGAFDFLNKPVTFEDLVRSIKEAAAFAAEGQLTTTQEMTDQEQE
jgi:DNA-binding NtrC family response regulator